MMYGHLLSHLHFVLLPTFPNYSLCQGLESEGEVVYLCAISSQILGHLGLYQSDLRLNCLNCFFPQCSLCCVGAVARNNCQKWLLVRRLRSHFHTLARQKQTLLLCASMFSLATSLAPPKFLSFPVFLSGFSTPLSHLPLLFQGSVYLTNSTVYQDGKVLIVHLLHLFLCPVPRDLLWLP